MGSEAPSGLHRCPGPSRVAGTRDRRVAIAEEVGRAESSGKASTICWAVQWAVGVFGHVEVDDVPAMVNKHDENEEDAQERGGNREEVEGDQVANMVGEERPPRLRRLGAPLRHQPGDGTLGHVDIPKSPPAVVRNDPGHSPSRGQYHVLLVLFRKSGPAHE